VHTTTLRIGSQRGLFDVPEGVAYFNTAYNSPLLNASRERLIEAAGAKSRPWERTPDDFFADAERIRQLCAALFGGEGLVLQKVNGEGTVFIAGCGDFIEYNLQPGQIMKVSTANVAAWEASVSYDIQSLGLKTALFGGEGLFVTTLTGPGRIILQSMTMSRLANSLVPYLPNRN